MNRRQKKKAFKKKYGYNPPKETSFSVDFDWNQIGEAMAELGKRAGDTAEYIAKKVIPEMVEQWKQVTQTFVQEVRELSETIKEIPEEEWEEYKKKMTDEQIAVAERIRRKKEDE